MSALRVKANTERGTQFFVNTATVLSSASADSSDFFNVSGSPITIPSGDGLTVGLVVLRDMGKTVRLPVATGGGSYGIRVLRKVQRVTQAAVTTTNDGVIASSGASPQYGVFYIETGVNSDTNAVRNLKWASVNVPF
jgi:hypothetical protein